MINSYKADLIYGATGVGKTHNIGKAAEYFYNKYGMKSRLVAMDAGGFDTVSSLISAKILDAWVLPMWANPIETLDLACQGWWPENVDDPNSKLIEPSKCDWAKLGFQGFEGLTSCGDLIMGKLRATGAKLTQEPGYSYKEGSKTFYGANMSYYGFVQDRLYDIVTKSHMLPVQHKVLWTALETKGEDETKAPVYGPAIVGKKSIGKAPQWFGNCLHLEMLNWDEEVEVEVVKGKKVKQVNVYSKPIMYLKPHADPMTRICFPAKVRAPFQVANKVPVTFEPDLGKFYEWLTGLQMESAGDVSKLMEG